MILIACARTAGGGSRAIRTAIRRSEGLRANIGAYAPSMRMFCVPEKKSPVERRYARVSMRTHYIPKLAIARIKTGCAPMKITPPVDRKGNVSG